MNSHEIQIIISDFDGTLVDTKEANSYAYQEAFQQVGLKLSHEDYTRCFGLRFDDFMSAMGVESPELKKQIADFKMQLYPKHFDKMKLNKPLIAFFTMCKESGLPIALASTARKENIYSVLNYFGCLDLFDHILTADDVVRAKPAPDIYQKVLEHFHLSPSQALIFEDSPVGGMAAQQTRAAHLIIKSIA
ncbi:MAG: HAD family phosphatase [Akkermansia sp.]